MITAALFTRAKTWKQLKCPWTEDQWIKKMWCVCVYIYMCVCVCVFVCVYIFTYIYKMGFLGGISGKEPACQCK